MSGAPLPSAPPTTDIATTADVGLLVRRFYQAAIPDPLLGPLFKAGAIDWSAHIPVVRSFWERELLGVAGYQGNVVGSHRRLLALAPVGQENLDRWVELFGETVDELFAGPVAALAKRRARQVAQVITRLATRDQRSTR
jgi:hemoglobin